MKKRALVKNHEYFTTVHAFVRMMLLNHDLKKLMKNCDPSVSAVCERTAKRCRAA